MADFLDFRLSPNMHIKIKVIMGFLLNYNGMCRTIAEFYCKIFRSVALIVVEIDFCQIDSISECKNKGYMADLLDFRLSPNMHIKIKVIMGFLLNYNGMCRTIAEFYCKIFWSVALIVVEIHVSLHGTLLLLILCRF